MEAKASGRPRRFDRPSTSDACTAVLDGVTHEFLGRHGTVVRALDNVSLSIGNGEFVGVLGPSGCGKSTLLRLLAGLIGPTEGRVSVAGMDPEQVSRRHRIGIAFQDHALLPWLSVRDNMALPFRLAGRQREDARMDHLLRLVGLEEFVEARPAQLSGGLRQRASIARALVLRPALLLLDEPMGSLDAVTRRRLTLELQRIWLTEGGTTALVTHSVEESVFLADRVVVLSARPGRVLADRPIPFPRPRGASLIREASFQAVAAELEGLLQAGWR
jgi:NitT/TauT family transport system ATP-binding protein